MKLLLTKAAVRRLGDLPPRTREALVARLKAIAADPFAAHANVQPLQGERDAFRLRQGGWRAVYRLDREVGEMRVTAVEPRGGVYR